ncbi:MAG: hypothetical protein HOE06_06125 [Candidatus Thioglobus sp.]|jgi:hypothetical protein|nr:hypothetical protein [Candidatus Thioglobus sp.]MBT7912749.1 hypothetical protein [Candidatus Bathyarchaeota archaeon]
MDSQVAKKLQRTVNVKGLTLDTTGFMHALREFAKINQAKTPKESEKVLRLCDRELKVVSESS